jgi:hypothetical protein
MQKHWARYDFFEAQRTMGLCLAGELQPVTHVHTLYTDDTFAVHYTLTLLLEFTIDC